MDNKRRFIETKRKILQNVCAESDGARQRDMANEDGGATETGEGGENDDKMNVRSDIEGQMQERGIEKAPGH